MTPRIEEDLQWEPAYCPQPHLPEETEQICGDVCLGATWRAFTAFIISKQSACTGPESNHLSYREMPKIPSEFYGGKGGRTRERSKKRKSLKDSQWGRWKRKKRKAGGVCLKNISVRLEH